MIVGRVDNSIRLLFGNIPPDDGDFTFTDVDFYGMELMRTDRESDVLMTPDGQGC